MEDSDKRDDERVTMLGELQGEMMVFQPMLVRDISKSGVTVETRFPLQIDSLHDVRLTLGETSIVIKGRVAHSRISDVEQDIVTYRSGLEFVASAPLAIEAIGTFLDAVKTDRGGG